MSLNKPTFLKLKLGDDLRKVCPIPASLQALKDLIRSLFSTADFHLRYVDEECDLVTIASDEEFQFACQTPLGPSLKIVLTPLGRSLAEPVDLSSMSSIRSLPREEVKTPVQLKTFTEQPKAVPEQPKTVPEQPKAVPEQPKTVPEQPKTVPEQPKVVPEQPKIVPEQPKIVPEQPKTVPEQPKTIPEQPKAIPEAPKPEAHHPCCSVEGIIGALGKRLWKGCARGKKSEEEAMVKALVRSEIYATLGIPAPAVHSCVQCNSCQVCPIVGVRYKCTICPDFDFCEVCEAQAPHPHPFLKINDPTQCIAPGKPQMKFMSHITLDDNTVVMPGATVLKEWRVRNPGESWPANVHVRRTKGNVDFQFIPVTPVAPGEEGVIRLMLKFPNKETACKGVFRLYTGEGHIFGDKLRVSVQVTNKRSYAAELEAVKAMGFADDQKILHFLDVYHGDVNQVIARLLQ